MSDDHPGADHPQARPATPSKLRAAHYLMAAFVVVAVMASALVIAQSARREKARQGGRQGAETPAGAAAPAPVGSTDAKLKVEACSGQCIAYIMEVIAEIAREYPDQIRAEFYTYESAEGQKFLSGRGKELATVFFNGKCDFVLGEGEDAREVSLTGPPGMAYDMEDLQEVFQAEFEAAYGALPEGFEERLSVLAEPPDSDLAPLDAQTEGSGDQG